MFRLFVKDFLGVARIRSFRCRRGIAAALNQNMILTLRSLVIGTGSLAAFAFANAANASPIGTSSFGVYTDIVVTQDGTSTGLDENTFDGGGQVSHADQLSGTFLSAVDNKGATSTAAARSNLATGTVGAKGSCSDYSQCNVATAQWKDKLSFDLTDLLATDTVNVGFRVALEGTMETNSQFYQGWYIQDITDTNNTSNLAFTSIAYDDCGAGLLYGTCALADARNRIFDQIGNYSNFSSTIQEGTFTLQGGQIDNLEVFLTITGQGSNFDVYNTAAFQLITDQSYTSASGVFLSEAPSAVPLPAALPLLLSGLGGLGFMGWRRRKAVAA